MTDKVLDQLCKHFIADGEKCYKQVHIDSSKQVYYALALNGKQYRLEFWIDTYATKREELQRELRNIFSHQEFQRDYSLGSYYSARGVCCRRPSITIEDLKEDYAKLKGLLNPIEEVVCNAHNQGKVSPAVGIGEISVPNLLGLNLVIPDYQRAYCWRKENIVGLLEDVSHWQQRHSNDKKYRIGTIILKEQSNKNYDVIDGQQRIITLGILQSELKKPDAKLEIRLGSSNQTSTARKAIADAKTIVAAWLKSKRDSAVDLDSVTVGLVVIGGRSSEDLSFNFFNHLNSSGVLLTDYELLKGHHLRYVKDDSVAEIMASRWRALDIIHGKGGKEYLLHKFLFRIRKWLAREDFSANADRLETHTLFKEFSLGFEPVEGLCTSYKTAEINSLLSGGIEFFDYVDRFRQLFESFMERKIIQHIEPLRCSETLWEGIAALLFLFYCKFGDVYLNEAAYAIGWFVSRIRNEWAIRRDFIGKRDEFKKAATAIARATHEGEVLGQLLNRLDCYTITRKGRTADAYWKALRDVAAILQGRSSKLAKERLNFIDSLTHEYKEPKNGG